MEVNLPLLEEIKLTLGCGAIYTRKRSVERPAWSNVTYFYTRSLAEALKVKEYFSTLTFRTSKGKDFALWGQCLDLMVQKRHLTKEGILEICRLRDQMNFRPTKNKWSLSEVEKILNEKPVHIIANFDATQTPLIHNQIPTNHTLFDMAQWFESKQGNHKENKVNLK